MGVMNKTRWIILCILFWVLVLSGCGSQYPAPEEGVIYVKIEMVGSAEPIREVCQQGPNIEACEINNGKRDLCHLMLNKHTWELHAVHELGHCFNVNNHAKYMGR